MPRIGNHIVFAGLLLVIGGCSKSASVSFTNWASTDQHSKGVGDEASAKLMAAGIAVEQQAKLSAKPDKKGRLAAPITTRTNFFPKQKAEARKVIGSSRAAALLASQSIKSLNYVPTGLAQPPEYLTGLKLIGNSLIWDIEESIQNHDYDKAIEACGSATRLGNSLMSGGAFEASLGASMINQARKEMVSVLGSLSGVQLGRLGAIIQKASTNRPPISIAIENERENMLLGLQQAQDMYESKKLDALEARIGISAHDSIDMLRAIQNEPEKGKALFDGIGNDIKARSDYYLRLVKNPGTAGLEPKKEEKKANQMLYRYFGSSIENLAPMLQATYCRTQLFILECYLKQKMKLQKPLPTSLNAFSKSATIDPFTGQMFYYKAERMSYILYSAGEDQIDNLGRTDSTFQTPDLLLEKAHS
jgi:hypothetical protein